MRIKSIADLGNINSETHQAKQLRAAFTQYERDWKRMSGGRTSGGSKAQPARSGEATLFAPRMPQELLTDLIHADKSLSEWEWVNDYARAVPGRKYEIDLAVPALRLGVEVDGWQYHGKHKESFLRDRDKDYLLSLQGWLVVRVQAGLVSTEPAQALERVRQFFNVWAHRQRHLLGL